MNWLWRHLTSVLFSLSGRPITALGLAIFVLTIGASAVGGSFARRMVTRLLLRRGVPYNQGFVYAIGRIVQYVVFFVGVLVGMENVGISLSTLAAFGAVLTVGIGFGLQNIAQNFISGLILLVERPVQKGDFVKVGDTVGTVDEIAMRATRVISRDGIAIIVPNSELITATVVNQSAGAHKYRTRVRLGVAYGTDLSRVREVLLEVARAHESVLVEPPPIVFFREFGDSSQVFELCVWLDDPQRDPVVTSDLRFAIDAAFRAHKIEMPFPQMVVHVHDDGRRGSIVPRERDAD